MSGGAVSQLSIRKALGAIKDSTTIGLAKVNSEYKELDVAIVKATNHAEQLIQEKHLRIIFDAVSASRSPSDVAYCIHALAKRLAKTHNWAVAIKTLIVIHRALREDDPSFREEMINYTSTKGHMLNLSHFKDDSNPAGNLLGGTKVLTDELKRTFVDRKRNDQLSSNIYYFFHCQAWNYSAWVRTYAQYLEERLECFRTLKYDVETEHSTSELDTACLLEQLPVLQKLLFRLLCCEPEGAAIYNNVIGCALSLVVKDSVKIYNAINNGTLYLVDKFLEMQHHDAVKALEICKKAVSQAKRLILFYNFCKCLNLGRKEKFPKIEQPLTSFIGVMEEYLKDASRFSSVNQTAIGRNKSIDGPQEPEPSGSPSQSLAIENTEVQVQTQTMDLLGLDDLNGGAAELEQHNTLSLAIVNNDPLQSPSSFDEAKGSNEWELALVAALRSNEGAVAESKLCGGLDGLTLNSLYDEATMRESNAGVYRIDQAAPNPFETCGYQHDPFCGSNNIVPVDVQMAAVAQQQTLMMQQQAVGQDNSNPFGNPFVGGPGVLHYPVRHPYSGYM